MNQIGIPDYQYYLSCNKERMVRLTFLEKSSYSNRKYQLIRLLFCYSFSKKFKFYWVKELFNTNQNWHGVSLVYLDSKTKIFLVYLSWEKKLVFHTEICEFGE